MRMTLRQLSVFVAVAQEGTVTKASDAVRLTQSAASMALADLEDGLGAPLFDRLGKRLQLNDLGRFLLPQALEILGRSEAFEQAAKGELQNIDLRIGATLTISDYLMPNLLAAFIQRQPQAQLQLQVGNTRQIIEAVNQFQLDVALIEGSCHLPQLQSIHWRDDELAVCCAPNHPLAQLDRALQVKDFDQIDWILREEGSGTREVFDHAIVKDLPNCKIRLTLGHNEAILKIVAGGMGLSCISKLAIEPLQAKGELVILDTPFWVLTRPLYLLTHRQKYQGPGLKAFMRYCQESI
ncbi:LysR family transcriptional regulator GigC [Acinetobacter rudis]|uniref:LysR family transcriptional regulator GigC n=1 Tax=Acinetobacter rudis TaxID=632955 RepID=A0AAW8J4M8_9GAMM|nr:LysR family transcriptional regulator GigC [Acinetobacter rudis]MDQ8934981.1 LysR family transcriptional regulator GigC [Acinetobacter rudis]MDQ8954234.1 LysR family transcriptional regulator GigC [Acinetobacter rudis]MDQ9017464.1 LysR family transcriptional regulator GigC [Acinetobacter rudis]